MAESELPYEIGDRREQMESICRRHRVRRLDLFGSGASGALDSDSDVDLLVEFEPMPPVEYASAYFGLLGDLERLLGRTVDLVEAPAIENPIFREAVERNRRTLYAA